MTSHSSPTLHSSPTSRIRLAIVDDDALVRSGLTLMLDGSDGIEVVGECADGGEVPALLDAHTADVVLMDIRMPRVDGITATRRVMARQSPPAVVMLTTFDTDEEVLGALRAGASGYLLKDMAPERIVAAVRAAATGEPVLSPEITRRLMASAATSSSTRTRAELELGRLTGRERDVVGAIGRGASNAQVAGELFLSVPTVKAHVTSILDKLGLENRTQIALLAHEAGLD